ncbi:hypothetical protein [Amycolatopsis anabasis]|uniref:hypothetical protein n=1 Tax=Amycolatopsis anabasis TaxID=1840409 RepID=UPI00131E314F|nr:hypothetical protein [Amycolatopsis anabasis]
MALRNALFRIGRDDMVLVPALRGADFLDAERRRGDFSQATVIARQGEGIDRLDRPGFLAVSRSQRGLAAHPGNGETVLVYADTVDDLVRGIVTYRPVPSLVGREVIAQPSRQAVRRTRKAKQRHSAVPVRRAAFSLGGALAIGGCLALAPSQSAGAQPVHDDTLSLASATVPVARNTDTPDAVADPVPLCINEPDADPCFGYSPEEPRAEPLTPVRPQVAPPVDPFFPRQQYEDLKEANGVARGMAEAIGRVVLGYSSGAGAYESAEGYAKRGLVAACAVWKPACLGVETLPPVVGWTAGIVAGVKTVFPEYVEELRKKLDRKWDEIKENAQRPIEVPPGGFCNGPRGACERPGSDRTEQDTDTVTPSNDVTEIVPQRPAAAPGTPASPDVPAGDDEPSPAPAVPVPPAPVQEPQQPAPVAPTPSYQDSTPIPSYQDPMPSPSPSVPAPAPDTSAGARTPTYSSSGPTPYIPSGGMGYQPPDYSRPGPTGGNGPGWGDAGVPPDQPGETVEVKPYPNQPSAPPSDPGYNPLA